MRALLYSPDSYGLGHVRRSLLVAESLLESSPGSCARVITGAPRAHYFRYPDGVDYLKIPSVTKDGDGRYVSRNGERALSETVALRSRLIEESAALFRPDIVYVDHVAQGLCGEIVPMLRRLGRSTSPTLRVLGMRDIIDEPEAVRRAWARDGVIDLLRNEYDQIAVFGQREFFDPVEAYGLPDDVARKTRFVGYIPRDNSGVDAADVLKRFAPRTGKLVVVTLGGGGDGNVLLRAFLDGYEALGERPPFEVLAVTGPLMSPGKRQRFKEWARRTEGVTVLEYCASLPAMLGAADFVVSMAGYNTVSELACAGARALFVPRVFPRREQHLRARLLAERGVARFLEPSQATPQALMAEVLAGLGRRHPEPGWGLAMTGLSQLAEGVRELRSVEHLAQPTANAAS